MGRMANCSKEGLNRGAWSGVEDQILASYIATHGVGKWASLPERAGLRRSGKSCRLRWLNYLRPDIKRGNISDDEEELILRLHRLLGNRWSLIAGRLPGRTDNEIKNYWNRTLSKRLRGDLSTHVPVKRRPQSKRESTPALAGGTVQPLASSDVARANFEQEACMPPLLRPEGSEGCSNNMNSPVFGSNSADELVAPLGLIAQTPSELDTWNASCDGISDEGFYLDNELLSFDAATIRNLRENDYVQTDGMLESNFWLFS